MENATIKAKILRFDPDRDEKPYFQSYVIPVDEQITVYELLNIIHRDHDGSLAFRDFKCFKTMCTTCIVKLDGKTVKSCSTPVKPNSEIRIEPVSGGEIIRDLVVDFKNM